MWRRERGSRVGRKHKFTARTHPCCPLSQLSPATTEFCDVQRKPDRMGQDERAHVPCPKGVTSAELQPEVTGQISGSSMVRLSNFSREVRVGNKYIFLLFKNVDNDSHFIKTNKTGSVTSAFMATLRFETPIFKIRGPWGIWLAQSAKHLPLDFSSGPEPTVREKQRSGEDMRFLRQAKQQPLPENLASLFINLFPSHVCFYF